MNHMVRIEQLAMAALEHDALSLRSLAQRLARGESALGGLSCRQLHPTSRFWRYAQGLPSCSPERRQQSPPAWAGQIAPVEHPLYLLKSAQTMPRLRRLCESESPPPLRRRNLFAPPTFLEFA
jgi:hypothetical protein